MPKLMANMLPLVLENLPRLRWAELVGSPGLLGQVFDATMLLNGSGRAKETCELLELGFVDDADFQARHEGLLDMLLDAHTELYKPRKKAALLTRAIDLGDQRMRSAALQRRSMLADAGD